MKKTRKYELQEDEGIRRLNNIDSIAIRFMANRESFVEITSSDGMIIGENRQVAFNCGSCRKQMPEGEVIRHFIVHAGFGKTDD